MAGSVAGGGSATTPGDAIAIDSAEAANRYTAEEAMRLMAAKSRRLPFASREPDVQFCCGSVAARLRRAGAS